MMLHLLVSALVALHTSCTSLWDLKLPSVDKFIIWTKRVLSLNIIFNDTQVKEEDSALDS